MFGSLLIDGYRGFRCFSMDGLSRINLLVGSNNSGKTSVLEALYLLAVAGDPQAILQIAAQRGERFDNEGAPRFPRDEEIDVSHLFFGHDLCDGAAFTISCKNNGVERFIKIRIREATEGEIQQETRDAPRGSLFPSDTGEPLATRFVLDLDGRPEPLSPMINLTRRGGLAVYNVDRVRRRTQRELMPVQYVPTESLSVSLLMERWKNILLTEAESLVLDALRFLEPGIERIAAVPSSSYYRGVTSRGGFLVRLREVDQPIPIGSLGDGTWRMLALAVALSQARGGVLLIDEIDTGLHYTVMKDMWKLVANTAKDLNVQVFATSHSYDCVKSLAAICESDEGAGDHVTIQRVEPDKGRAVKYSEAEIKVAAEHHIEVR